MLMIRMARFGAKKKPTYRVVVIDKERARNSRSVEVVGFYNPVAKPAQVQLNRERIEHWIKAGAQPSDTVRSLLSHEGIMLRLHLTRKGKSLEDINMELVAWRKAKDERMAGKMSKKQRRALKKAETAEVAAEEAKA